MYKIVIPGTLPGLNEYLRAERKQHGNWNAGNQMKQQAQSKIMWCIRKSQKAPNFDFPVILHYHYYEPTKRRDLDNIAATAHKFIQDALVKGGVLPNDGWRYISGFTDEFRVDTKNPRIEVVISNE